MKKSILGIVSLSLLTALAFGLGMTKPYENVKAAGAPVFTEGEWETVKGSTPSFTESNGTFVGGSKSWMANFYVKEFKEAIGDYEVIIRYQGTMTYPNTKQVQFGIVPWYLDDNNYLVGYCEWSNVTRVSGMFNFNLTGRVNGALPYRSTGDGNYMAKEWDDIWMDGTNMQYAVAASQESTIKIVKQRSEDGQVDNFTFYLNNNLLAEGTKNTRDTKQYEGRTAKVGFYGYNDTFTIKDFQVNHLHNNKYYSAMENDIATAKNGWSKLETGYAVDSRGKDNFNDVMLLDNKEVVEGGYGIEFSAEVKASDGNWGVGGMVWYQDQYNYLAGVVKQEDGRLKAGFEGRLVSRQDTVLVIEEIKDVKEVVLDLENVAKWTFEKRGIKLRLLADDNLLAEYENKTLITCTVTGLTAYGVNIEFKNYTKLNSLAYIPYDWYSTTMVGKTYYISSADDTKGTVAYSKGLFTFTENAVTPGDKTKLSSIYYKSGFYAYTSMTVNYISEITTNSVIGLYPWLEDTFNYVAVYADKDVVTVKIVFGESTQTKTYPLPSGYHFTTTGTETKLLRASVSFEGLITVSIGEKDESGNNTWYEVVKAEDDLVATDKDSNATPNVGLICGGTACVAKVESLTGFTPYEKVECGEWEFYGSMPNTWTYIDETTLSASQINGTAYMNARALKYNRNVRDFFMGATFTATNCSQAEQKAAFYPWYLDGSNYLIVMFSKWTVNASASIVFTGRINGQVLGGSEWHDFTTAYTFEGVANKLEVEIRGNRVFAYLNGGSNPIQSVTFEGLSERNVENAKSGFFFYNCDLMIEDFVVNSDSRVYRITEQPVISHVGTIKETGTVGESCKLPIFTAGNSVGDVLEVEVIVTDPNGQEVTVTGSKFTPEIEGVYHVKVTCTDNWGNEAVPLEYDITVSRGSGSDTSSSSIGQSSGSDGGKRGGCGGSIIASSMLFAIMSVAGVGVHLIIKKRK
ncbi:MAG TPA: hypothetical protein GX010_04585 [Erysipelotrichaceae bacterium]|nr:hypothetical protein [Erysipelotrichaceae bacterium]